MTSKQLNSDINKAKEIVDRFDQARHRLCVLWPIWQEINAFATTNNIKRYGQRYGKSLSILGYMRNSIMVDLLSTICSVLDFYTSNSQSCANRLCLQRLIFLLNEVKVQDHFVDQARRCPTDQSDAIPNWISSIFQLETRIAPLRKKAKIFRDSYISHFLSPRPTPKALPTVNDIEDLITHTLEMLRLSILVVKGFDVGEGASKNTLRETQGFLGLLEKGFQARDQEIEQQIQALSISLKRKGFISRQLHKLLKLCISLFSRNKIQDSVKR